jgi:hypothetical protein
MMRNSMAILGNSGSASGGLPSAPPPTGCWVVELEQGVWLADGEGDPPRTLVEANARQFDKYLTAKMQLSAIRRMTHRQFVNAWIHPPNPRASGANHTGGPYMSQPETIEASQTPSTPHAVVRSQHELVRHLNDPCTGGKAHRRRASASIVSIEIDRLYACETYLWVPRKVPNPASHTSASDVDENERK